MEVLEFRMINTSDIYDETYDDGSAWSRVYEYPLVINKVKEYNNSAKSIHNTSWGYMGIHLVFKEKLESLFETTNSDIQRQTLPNTTVYDIRDNPPIEYVGKFDVVINVSTLEEVDGDHFSILNNLLKQVKDGGLLIITFDLPGLQLDKFEAELQRKITTTNDDISGVNSKLINTKYSNLSCGLLIIRK